MEDDCFLEACKHGSSVLVKLVLKKKSLFCLQPGTNKVMLLPNLEQKPLFFEHRRCEPGLNVEALCQNKNCKCAQQSVVQPFGFGMFDLVMCSRAAVCPVC